MSSNKQTGTSTKHSQIRQASTQTFVAVAVSSVVVSMSIVMLNILWETSKFNSSVHDAQGVAKDILETNIEAAKPLQESFDRLEISGNLIPTQADNKKNSEVILDALPSKFDFPELAASISNLAKVSSVELKSFRGTDIGSDATQSSPSPVAEQIPFTMEVEGSYSAVAKFLLNMENSIRPIKTLSLDLSGTDNKLRATINAETSYQPAFDLKIQKRTVQQ